MLIIKRTFILIHGWKSSPDKWPNAVGQKLLRINENKVNVFIVDWSKIAELWRRNFAKDYFYKSSYTQDLGKQMSKLLDRLQSRVLFLRVRKNLTLKVSIRPDDSQK